MVTVAVTLTIAGAAFGAFGSLLLFIELFQLPGYVNYKPDLGSYSLDLSPTDPQENTWIGRIGALILAIGFALVFAGEVLSAGLA